MTMTGMPDVYMLVVYPGEIQIVVFHEISLDGSTSRLL